MSDTTTTRGRWALGRDGWPARFPLVQPPNAPLWAALAARLLAALTDDPVEGYAHAAFYAALAAWAWLELAEGANWFRRLLGAAALAFVVAQVGKAL